MIGYSVYYFVRKNFSFAIPSLSAEYGITKSSFGILMTLIGLIYGVSKLLNGVLADRVNARIHMTVGLLACTILNFIFGWGASISTALTGSSSGAGFVNTMVILFAVLLILNNIFQGCGCPPCNRLLTHWVPPSELAGKMSLWNVAHSLGGSLVAILCGFILTKSGMDMSGNPEIVNGIAANLNADMDNPSDAARVLNAAAHYGAWRWCFWIPAMIGLAGVLFTFAALRDTPKSVGLPEIPGTETELDNDDSPAAFKAYIKKMVFRNPVVWIVAVADIFIYIIRYTIFDWGPTFLQESFALNPQQSGYAISAFEIGGIVGMLLCGWASDRLFHSQTQKVCAISMVLTTVFTAIFAFLPSGTNAVLMTVIIAMIGLFLYGPQALVVVIAANHATKKAASTALGVIGFMSYLSSIVSGVVVGFMVDPVKGAGMDWKSIFYGMIAVAAISAILLLSIWNKSGDGYKHQEI